MQWLLNFNQSFYYTRLAYPQNFIIFGSQKLKIWFKQVCMHSKTHLKFQFNSSINSTTSAHIIFFLNTTLHYESNKIGTTQFGSTKQEIQKYQISIQNCIFELALWTTQSLTCGTWPSADPTGQRQRSRGGAFDGATVVLLADGEDSGETTAPASSYRRYAPNELPISAYRRC